MSSAPTPQFAVIVPVAPERQAMVFDSLRTLGQSSPRAEVVVERGRNVSRNRNAAVGRSRAPILAFTDDDCAVESDWLLSAQRFFAEHPEFDAVGGPQLNLPGEGALGRAIGHALGSRFGTCRTRHRFKRGALRLTATQCDLTSANLFITRAAFDRWGPFDERLWPNEETALLQRIERDGGRIAYDPSIVVRHQRRDSFARLVRQCFGYGRGRARQWRIEGTQLPALEQLVPLAFLLYTATLPGALQLSVAAAAPFALYSAITLFMSAAAALRQRDARVGVLLPAVFAVLHLAYPAGILFELMRAPRLERPSGAAFPMPSTSAVDPGGS